MLDPEKGLLLYTDGSYSQGGPGGWAWVAVDMENHLFGSGFVPPPTTNNRMELKACIEGLTTLFEEYGPCEIEVVSDSAYVVLGNQFPDRARNVNLELWDDLDAASRMHTHIQWRHIRGHKGCHWNEEVDKLAVKQRKEAKW